MRAISVRTNDYSAESWLNGGPAPFSTIMARRMDNRQCYVAENGDYKLLISYDQPVAAYVKADDTFLFTDRKFPTTGWSGKQYPDSATTRRHKRAFYFEHSTRGSDYAYTSKQKTVEHSVLQNIAWQMKVC